MIARVPLLIIVVLILAASAFSAIWHPRLPESVPTHFNAKGEADDFGPRWELTVGMPGLMILLTAVLYFLPRLGPFRRNIESFRPTYGRIAVMVVAALAAIHVLMLLKAEGRGVPMGRAMPIVLGVLLATIGNWFGKLRRNFYVGIRTPWTIANDEVWERTHRLGGRLFVAYGILLVVAGLALRDPAGVIWLFLGLMGIVLWLAVYSAVIYRRGGQVDRFE